MTDYDRLFEAALAEHPPRLSEDGAARKRAMAAELAAAVRRRRRARRAARTGALQAAAALLLLLLWPRTPALPGGPPAETSGVRIVRSDPDTLWRYAVRSRFSAVVFLDDDQLLAELARAGHRSGILRAGTRVILTDPLPEPGGE